MPSSARESNPAPSVFGREEYHNAIRSLGSAKMLHSLPQVATSAAVASSSSSRGALVPEEEYVADDWLEDDVGETQPKKKRRLRESNGEETFAKSQNKTFIPETANKGTEIFCLAAFLLNVVQMSKFSPVLQRPPPLPPPSAAASRRDGTACRSLTRSK